MDAPLLLWVARALWLALPFTLAEQIDQATSGADGSLRWAASLMFWLAWVVGFGSSLVPLPATLTLLRILAPAAPLAALVALVAHDPGTAGWAGLALGLGCAASCSFSSVGDWFVDGASYGDERRFALKPPALLLLGPLQLAWLLTVVPLPAGVLLLADRRWVLGSLITVIGLLTAWWGYFAAWQLARRWAVFVPAGMTLVDEMALAQAVLFPAPSVTRLAPAREGTEATDLTAGAPGLVLQLDLSEPVEMVTAPRRGNVTEVTATDSILFVPSLPGSVLREAERRRLPVGTSS